MEAGLNDAAQVFWILAGILPAAVTLAFVFRALRVKFGGGLRQGAGAPQAAIEIERIRAQDRADARALYERVTRDKLDVLKTAIAMGYTQQDLQALDARLEQLIGTEKLHALLQDPQVAAPLLTSQLLDLDLAQELEQVKPRRETQAQ